LKEIGKGFEVHEVNDAVVVESIQELQRLHTERALRPGAGNTTVAPLINR
jgi:hypothetical protein